MFEKMTLEQYNQALASKAPTPGGGSALAVVGTVACSLVEMSVNVTLTKPASAEDIAFLQHNATFFARARARLAQLADEDAQAFRHIIDCTHLPDDTDAQKQMKAMKLQRAYHKAALVPLDVMQMCKEALTLAKTRIYPMLYKYVASDCKIGIDLFLAIIQNSLENVYANTSLITDGALKKLLETQGETLLKEAQAI